MIEGNGKHPVILLVEDDPGDQEIVRRALDDGCFRSRVNIVEDGEEALDYLYRRGRFADSTAAPRPDLILLDLNLPKIDGNSVIENIRSDPALRRLPIVVLTTSQHEEDIVRSYDQGINSYIAKPVDLPQLINIIQTLETYWFQVVVLPPR